MENINTREIAARNLPYIYTHKSLVINIFNSDDDYENAIYCMK